MQQTEGLQRISNEYKTALVSGSLLDFTYLTHCFISNGNQQHDLCRQKILYPKRAEEMHIALSFNYEIFVGVKHAQVQGTHESDEKSIFSTILTQIIIFHKLEDKNYSTTTVFAHIMSALYES